MENGNGKHASFKQSVDTMTLVENLSQAEYHDMARYDDLSELIGRNVQKEAGHILRSALKSLARDYGMFFSCVRGEGVMRITESEHLQSVPLRVREEIRNRATKGLKNLSWVRPGNHSREEETKRLENISYFGTVKEFAKEKEVKEVPARPQAPANASKKALELFKKK